VAAVDVYKLQNYVYAVKKDVSRRKTSHMKIALGGRSSGGGSKSQLMQFQADLLGMPVLCAAVAETTALGAAYLAGLAVGFWPTPDALPSQQRKSLPFEPRMARSQADGLRKRWNEALHRAKNWEHPPAT